MAIDPGLATFDRRHWLLLCILSGVEDVEALHDQALDGRLLRRDVVLHSLLDAIAYALLRDFTYAST